MNTSTLTSHRQRGISLIEALIAFAVLSLGLLAIGKLQSHLRLQADVARQRTEAVRLAQEDLERLRAYAAVDSGGGTRAYADIVAATRNVDGSTRYTITRRIDALATVRAKATTVAVNWVDGGGQPQQISLDTVIAGSNPAHSGALALPPSGSPVKAPQARSIEVPLGAKDLGDGSSVFKPLAAGTTAFVFSNTTGEITSRCTAPTTPTASLTRADLSGCVSMRGFLLSGVVRVAVGDTLPTFGMSLALTGGIYPLPPSCQTEVKTSRTAEPYAAYHCVVYPLADRGTWSGRLDVVPDGWSLGIGASDRRVCRYSADRDGGGIIDNLEHPASYRAVGAALTQQNFLIVKGTQNCPLDRAVSVSGSAADVYADLSTVQHQP